MTTRMWQMSLVGAGLALLALGPAQVRAQAGNPGNAGQVNASRINKDRAGVTAKGHDVVAYFSEGKPTRGVPEFKFEWRGATWYFASAANRDLFAASPEKYAPQFGGFCGYAVSRGYTADVDPAAWRIVDGRLILNYSLEARRLFERDTPGNLQKADSNWPAVSRSNK